jgi:hypothetical protein
MTGEHPVAGRYSFTTFEEYCQQRWELDDRRVRQLVETADAASKLEKWFIREVPVWTYGG